MHIIAPSLLSADFSNLAKDIEMVNKSKAGWFHLDVMDGVFVPNISFGFPVIKAVKKLATKPLDVHLMISNPEKYVEQFAEAGASLLSVHFEACIHLHRTLQQIKSHKMLAGIAINPHTPVSSLSEIIAEADLICMMSVNPGFGGQRFIENTYSKLSELKELIIQKHSPAKIEIDGGVDMSNADKLLAAGADVLVAGNSVFSAADPATAIAALSERNLKTI